MPNYPNITFQTERGPMSINEYVDNILPIGFYGGELEITIASSLYNINIATF